MTGSGRSYRRRHFAPGDASLFASVRQKKAAWVRRLIRAGRGHMADQSGVWDELASKNAKRGVANPTEAMRDFYQGYEGDMAEAPRELAPVPGQTGSLVYLSGRWAGMAPSKDISPMTAVLLTAFTRAPRLIRSYAAREPAHPAVAFAPTPRPAGRSRGR